MLLMNKERFLKLPAGVFYVTVGPKEDPATALITNGIQVKGTSNDLTDAFDCYEGNLSFSPTPEDDGTSDWPCISNVYDEEKGISESMDINLTFTRGGLIGEDKLRFIVLEPADMSTIIEWMQHSAANMGKWLAEQGDDFPEKLVATKQTIEDDYFG